jgi:hypothetical protein
LVAQAQEVPYRQQEQQLEVEQIVLHLTKLPQVAVVVVIEIQQVFLVGLVVVVHTQITELVVVEPQVREMTVELPQPTRVAVAVVLVKLEQMVVLQLEATAAMEQNGRQQVAFVMPAEVAAELGKLQALAELVELEAVVAELVLVP